MSDNTLFLKVSNIPTEALVQDIISFFKTINVKVIEFEPGKSYCIIECPSQEDLDLAL